MGEAVIIIIIIIIILIIIIVLHVYILTQQGNDESRNTAITRNSLHRCR